MAGVVCMAAITAVLWWWQVYPMQQQLAQVRDTAQGAATVWLTTPDPTATGNGCNRFQMRLHYSRWRPVR